MRTDEPDLVYKVLKGNLEAIDFCRSLFWVSQILDDLYDQDREVTPEELTRLVWEISGRLICHPFALRYGPQISPLLRAGAIDWIDATRMEKGSDHDRTVAFVLRDTISNLLIHVAGIIGGDAWMLSVSQEIRDHIYEDTLADYLAPLEKPS